MTYIVFIELTTGLEIDIGRLGKVHFSSGIYTYIGSAKKGVRGRIERHLRMNKRLFWHIDYLTSNDFALVRKVLINPKELECKTAQLLLAEGFDYVKGFGSSDCNCPSHLFFIDLKIGYVEQLVSKIGFRENNLVGIR